MTAPTTVAEARQQRDVPALTFALRKELVANAPNIPKELKELKGWVVWRVTKIDEKGKFNKVPHYPNGSIRRDEQGSVPDLANLGTWAEVVAAFTKDKSLAGVGVAMLTQWGLVAFDADHCIDDGKINDEVMGLTDATYCEISPSGTGIRAFWRGTATNGKNGKGYELYAQKQFVTVTGNIVPNFRHSVAECVPADPLPLLEGGERTALEGLCTAEGKARQPRTGNAPEPPARASKTERLTAAAANDHRLRAIIDAGLYERDMGDGKHSITCPFEEQHSDTGRATGDGDTVYLIPHTNGYAVGTIHCYHSHENDQRAYWEALGYDVRAAESAAMLQEFDDMSAPTEEGEEDYLRALAALPEIDYQRRRSDAAAKLSLGLAALDKVISRERRACAAESKAAELEEEAQGGSIIADTVEPWDNPVTGGEVLDEAAALLRRYVVAGSETLHTAALWSALSWFVEHATVLPLAVITAPEKNCGKSTLLGVMQKLVNKPLPASNISPAALFRCVEAWGPTLLIDEADTFAKENEELRGILNSGHTRASAFVVRVVGEELEPRTFSTWGAKALSGIGKLPPTIMSRAVVLKMRRKLAGETVENLRHAVKEDFDITRRKFARWVKDQGTAFAELHPQHPALINRDADNWEPLLALAQLAGGEWACRAARAALAMTEGAEESQTKTEELLTDIREAFSREGTPHIFSSTLLSQLCFDPDSRWKTYNRGNPLTGKQLSVMLSDFGVMRHKSLRVAGEVSTGYKKDDFADAFRRYLPA